MEKLEFVMNGILLRLKIDPAAVQSPRGSNALQAVQTLFGISLKKVASFLTFPDEDLLPPDIRGGG